MNFVRFTPAQARRGFTLIELMMVIALMIVIATLSIGAIKNFGTAYELDSTIQGISGLLNAARQTALSQNKYVQVRFYEQTNNADPRYQQYYAIGTYISDSPFYTNASTYDTYLTRGVMKPLGSTYVFPSSIGIVKSANNSYLLDALSKETDIVRGGTDSSGKMKGVPWVSFYFNPQGAIDVPYEGTGTNKTPVGPTKSYFSLCEARQFKDDKLPPNYAVVLFDPANGRMQVTRP